jgi:hypothetical protein
LPRLQKLLPEKLLQVDIDVQSLVQEGELQARVNSIEVMSPDLRRTVNVEVRDSESESHLMPTALWVVEALEQLSDPDELKVRRVQMLQWLALAEVE